MQSRLPRHLTSAQAHKSSKEQRLLNASKTFDQGLSRHHLSDWDSILDPNVILHKDSITLYDDLHGLSTVKGYFQVSLVERHILTDASVENHDVDSGCCMHCLLRAMKMHF